MYRWIGGAVVVAAALVAVLVSGCGGDSEAASLTKAEYVKQANKICAERKQEWKTAQASYRKELKEKNAEKDFKLQKELVENILEEKMLPAFRKQLEALEELGAPAGKEKEAEKMVTTLSKTLDSVEKGPILGLLETSFSDFEEKAEDLGLSCPLL